MLKNYIPISNIVLFCIIKAFKTLICCPIQLSPAGILQKGDGENMYLKQKPRILRPLMGDGRQREVSCTSCDGDGLNQRLLTPADLASAPDGSLYVADFNLIRRIMPDRTVRTVVKLK